MKLLSYLLFGHTRFHTANIHIWKDLIFSQEPGLYSNFICVIHTALNYFISVPCVFWAFFIWFKFRGARTAWLFMFSPAASMRYPYTLIGRSFFLSTASDKTDFAVLKKALIFALWLLHFHGNIPDWLHFHRHRTSPVPGMDKLSGWMLPCGISSEWGSRFAWFNP